jgi:hypothetical protein
MEARLSASRAGRSLPPKIFLVLVSVRGSVDLRAIVRLEKLGQNQKSNCLIGNWTRNLPAWSVVQPTTLPCEFGFIKWHIRLWVFYSNAIGRNMSVVSTHKKIKAKGSLLDFPSTYSNAKWNSLRFGIVPFRKVISDKVYLFFLHWTYKPISSAYPPG